MSIAIREATLSDAELLAGIHAECFEEAWDAQSFQGLLKRPGCLALIANDGVEAAFILIQLAGGEAEIQSLGTRRDARRKGLGAALVQQATAKAFTKGATVIFLEVAADNAAALSLYLRLKFEEAGRRRAYYPRGKGKPAADALVLRSFLPMSQN